jgi:hypothetical protein
MTGKAACQHSPVLVAAAFRQLRLTVCKFSTA